MKRIFFITFFLGLFSVLNAFDTKIFAGVTAGKVDGDTYTQFTVGQSSTTRVAQSFIFGFANSLSYGKVRSGASATTVDLDLKAGYDILHNLTIYGIGSGAVQYYDDSTYTGLGYGGSLEYRFTPTLALEGTYKTMRMSKSSHSYDYNTANLSLKVGF
ncbi:outer membrane protein [Aliarcobacter lanthieri]|uniref:outer membrane protein n=1 Tax=Aliarcobacter lanthieri TaxID=1355374 RepID=UPI003AFADD01